MSKFLSITALCLALFMNANAQQTSQLHPAPKLHKLENNNLVKTLRTNSPASHQARSGSRTALVCDSNLYLDYGNYSELVDKNAGLNYNGSLNGTGGVPTHEITSFIDTIHGNKIDYSYAAVIFDSLAFALTNAGTFTGTFYYPLRKATVTLDSFIIVYTLHGDSTKFGNDSLVFDILRFPSGVTTPTTVNTIVYSGAQLYPFQTPAGRVSIRKLPVAYSFSQGDAFGIRVRYLGKDTSTHYTIGYSYADSCGSITFQGQTFGSPAYTPNFVGSSQYGEIRNNSGVASVTAANNGFAYNIPGYPTTCSFLYEQNLQIIPIITVCMPFATAIQASKAAGCPGDLVDLATLVYGNRDTTKLTFSWTASSGNFTGSTTGSNAQIALGATNSTVIVSVADTAAHTTTADTFHLTSNGVTVTFNPPTKTINCGSSATLVPSITTNGTKTYLWSDAAAHTTLALTGVNAAGTYSITVTNSFGCVGTGSINVTYASGATNTANFTSPPNATGHNYICRTQNYTFTNTSAKKTGWSANWTFGDPGAGTSTLTDGNYTYTTTSAVGTPYIVTLTMDSAGCNFVASKPINVGNCVGIQDVAFENNISVVPNPSNGNVTFTINGADQKLTIKLYNLLGEEVKTISETEVSATLVRNYNFSDLANGTYIVKIQDGTRLATKKLTINK